MNTDVLAALVKSAAPAQAQSGSETALGKDLLGAGALATAGGFGGQHLATNYLNNRPLAGLGDQLNGLARFVGTKPPVASNPALDTAKFFKARGGGIGKLGLHLLTAGLPALALGRKLDRAHAANAELSAQAGPAKLAFDFDAVKARLHAEKRAGFGGWAAKQLTGIGRKALPMARPSAGTMSAAQHAALPIAQHAPGARGALGFNPGIMARNAGMAGAGAVGVGHMQDDAANRTDWTAANPLSWFQSQRAQNPEDVFRRNYGQYSQMSGDLSGQINESLGKGDFEGAKGLQQKLQSGDFGGGGSWYEPWKWRMGGLNPFTTQRASYYQGHAQNAQNQLQGQYTSEMGKVGPQHGDFEHVQQLQEALQGGNLLPNQAQGLQQQLSALQGRMKLTPGSETDAAKQIRQRMEQAGMRRAPYKPGGPPTGPGFGFGQRPGSPAGPGGGGLNPNDFKYDPWWEVVNRAAVGGQPGAPV